MKKFSRIAVAVIIALGFATAGSAKTTSSEEKVVVMGEDHGHSR